jgi:hypothetical protein
MKQVYDQLKYGFDTVTGPQAVTLKSSLWSAMTRKRQEPAFCEIGIPD